MSTLNVSNLAGPSSTGTAAVLSSINGGPISGARNRIINGDMRIDQRNAGASVTPLDGQYTLDRWACFRSQASKYSVQQNAGAVIPPGRFTDYLGVTSLSAYSSVSADYFGIAQFIEGFNVSDLTFGTPSALPVTLSFWARSSLTGTFGGALRNHDNTRTHCFSYSITSANTWEFKTLTIPGDTAGTWLYGNNKGLTLWFDLGSGSNSTGTPGTWNAGSIIRPTGSQSIVGTNGATFYLSGVQLEPGTVATPFERRSYGQELALCQRYYYSNSSAYFPNAGVALPSAFKVSMRVSPTITWAGTGGTITPTNTENTYGTSTSNNVALLTASAEL